jgi:hypothetical protein
VYTLQINFSGGYNRKGTPHPIPNREVKPLNAEGTAWQLCGSPDKMRRDFNPVAARIFNLKPFFALRFIGKIYLED